jgi:succinate dehydrogenase hydrophobic anchor subunit
MHPVVLDYKIRNKQISIKRNLIKLFIQLHVSAACGHHQTGLKNILEDIFLLCVLEASLMMTPWSRNM